MASHAEVLATNLVNNIIHRAFIGAGVLATREPDGPCNNAGEMGKPVGVTTVPCNKGRCLAWDATWTLSCNLHIQKFSVSAGYVGSPAKTADNYKSAKYSDLTAGIDVVPVAIKSTGVRGE